MGTEELRRRDEEWLRNVREAHARWTTPDEVLDEGIARAVGAPVRERLRVEAGLSNEVYRCEIPRGEVVAVRVARRSAPHFEQERWAIERCREAGVPVAEVLLLEHRVVDGEPLSIIVQRWLPGIELGRVVRRRGRDDPVCARLLSQAGALLARIHAVATTGFGELDGAGRGPLQSWDEFMIEGLGEIDRSSWQIDRALVALDAHRDLLARQRSRLIHHDFEPSHILVDVDAGVVTGILDLEDCKGGDPAYDFAQWDVVHDARAPAVHVLAGYESVTPLGRDFVLRRRLGEIRYRVRQLVRGDVPAEDAVRGLEAALSEFS